jgi:MFS family permease
MDRHFLHLHIIKDISKSKILKDKYYDLLISDTFRLVALTLISMFVPIYLIKVCNFTLLEVAIYELLFLMTSLSLHYFNFKCLINKIGIKTMLIISYPINVIFFYLLANFQIFSLYIHQYLFLLILCCLQVIYSVFYWSAHHIFFIDSTPSNESGKKWGIMQGIPRIAAIISPFIGGILITTTGFSSVFYVSIFFMIIASIALFFCPNIEYNPTLDIKKVLNFKDSQRNWIYFFQGVFLLEAAFFWPLILFFLKINFIFMGFLYTASNFAYALIGYYSGKKGDLKGNRTIARVGAVGHGFFMILKGISKSLITITTFQVMGGMFGALLTTSLNASFFRISHQDAINNIMSRELYMFIGRIVSLMIFIIFLLSIQTFGFSILELLISFIILSGILTMSMNFIIKKNYTLIN